MITYHQDVTTESYLLQIINLKLCMISNNHDEVFVEKQ